jgi:hypothetical protein
MSAILGSMSADTSCVASFSWTYQGSEEYRALLRMRTVEVDKALHDIEAVVRNLQKNNETVNTIKSCDQSIQKHLYLNYRQYVGNNMSS